MTSSEKLTPQARHALRLDVQHLGIEGRRASGAREIYPDGSLDEALAELVACRAMIARLEEMELERAKRAREVGASWAILGAAAGIARSSAKSRYDHWSIQDRRQSFKRKKQAPPVVG